MFNQNTDHGSRREFGVSRRALLTTGAVGIAGLSGCSGSDEPSETTDDDGGETSENGNGDSSENPSEKFGSREPVEPAYTNIQPVYLTENFNWNSITKYNKNRPYYGRHLQYAPQLLYYPKEAKFVPVTIESWERDGDTMRFQMSDQFQWSNGDDLNADDLVTRWKLDKYMNTPPLKDTVSAVEKTGEYSVELTLTEDLNTNIFLLDLTGASSYYPRSISTNYDRYKQWLDKFEDAEGDEDAMASVREEAVQWRVDDPLGHGPYLWNKGESRNKMSIYDKNPEYPWGYMRDQLEGTLNVDASDYVAESNIERWEMKYYGEQLNQMIVADDVDSTAGTLNDQLQDQVKDWWHKANVPMSSGHSMIPNLDDDIFGNRNVRKALMHAVDREVFATLSQADLMPVGVPCGMSPSMYSNWVSDDVLDAMNTYEVDHDRASELLEREGFERDGGEWYTPDGDRFEVDIKTNADYNTSREWGGVVAVLKDFGIGATNLGLESTKLSNDRESGNFRLTRGYHGGGPMPYHAYDEVFDGEVQLDAQGVPTEFEVPPVGEPDSSETVTINTQEVTQELRRNISEDKIKENVEQLTWAFNQALPRMPVSLRNFGFSMTDDVWTFPDHGKPTEESDHVLRHKTGPWFHMNYYGMLQGQHENRYK